MFHHWEHPLLIVYNIPSSLIDQAQDIYITLVEAWKEFQCGTSTNKIQLEHVFSGSLGRPAFHIPVIFLF